MTSPDRSERERQLISARRACLLLAGYAAGVDYSIFLPPAPETREQIADLLEQFGRLDAGERKRINAGRESGHKGGVHGSKGGAPKGNRNRAGKLKKRNEESG